MSDLLSSTLLHDPGTRREGHDAARRISPHWKALSAAAERTGLELGNCANALLYFTGCPGGITVGSDETI